jgi:LmbE family N-acetylglucosaminyl deacetylase
MAMLVDRGERVVLVLATGGELGSAPEQRRAETEVAAGILGVARLELLGYRDSGMAGDPANAAPGAFAAAPVEEAVDRVAAILADEDVTALVVYDGAGIYGHPDHVQVHRVGMQVAELAGVATVYESTVDREYLHFVETHVVVEAGIAGGRERPSRDLGLAASALGSASVEITTTLDVRPVLARKRRAMAAHVSQLPETASPMQLATAAFEDVYGWEWYVRRGPVGPIDALASEITDISRQGSGTG